MAMPPEIADLAGQIDQKMEQGFASAAPVVTADTSSLNMVVASFNKLAPLFGVEEYPSFTAPLQGEPLPSDFLRVLTMVRSAAQQADVDVPDLDVQDDGDLKVLAGTLAALARNKDFTRFLKSKPEMEETSDSPSATEGTPAAPSGDDDMTLFASRMK